MIFGHIDNRKRMVKELEDARRGLLDAQSAQEYAAAMVEYHSRRIARLSQALATSTTPATSITPPTQEHNDAVTPVQVPSL